MKNLLLVGSYEAVHVVEHDVVTGVLGAVREFTPGAPQSDDVTVLAMKWTPDVE